MDRALSGHIRDPAQSIPPLSSGSLLATSFLNDGACPASGGEYFPRSGTTFVTVTKVTFVTNFDKEKIGDKLKPLIR